MNNGNPVYFSLITGSILFLFLCSLIALLVLAYKRRASQLIESNRLLEQELLKTKVELQEDTLRNISLELHDNICQVLSITKMQLEHLIYRKASPMEMLDQIKTATTQLEQAIEDLRNLTYTLNGSKITEMGLATAIRRELLLIQRSTKLQCRFQCPDEFELPELSEVQTLLLYRIVQEAVHNAVRHSGADKLLVELLYGGNRLSLVVQDNGKGFSPDLSPEGLGLKNIRYRVEKLNGDLRIDTTAGSGCKIYVELENI